ncbi:MAG TPA: hypothetical protein VF275_01400 [Gammaproteobacteria bacterium]
MKKYLFPLVFMYLCCDVVRANEPLWSLAIEFPTGPFLEYRFADQHALAFSFVDFVDRDDHNDHPPYLSQHTQNSALRYLWLAGDGNHRYELGLALLYMDENLRLTGQAAVLSGHEVNARFYAGYRYEDTDGGFQLRTGLTAFSELADHDADKRYSDETFKTLPWPYLSLGWSFR